MTKCTKIVKINKAYTYWGFGFCVKLLNVPTVYVSRTKEWVPDINYNTLDNYVRNLIVNKEVPLTDSELWYLVLVFLEKNFD